MYDNLLEMIPESTSPDTRVKGKHRVGKAQYKILVALEEAGPEGLTTGELKQHTDGCLRTIQEAVNTLHDRRLIKKKELKHNKNRWYYLKVAEPFVKSWPAAPPRGGTSEK